MNRHEAAPPTDAWATEIRALGVEPNTMPIAGGPLYVGRKSAKPTGDLHGAAHSSARLLVAVTWVSGAIFAACIIAFFSGLH